MATVTQVFCIDYVARLLNEEPELLQAIVSHDDNLSYGSIISVHTGSDEAITSLTRDGREELEQMLAPARRSTEEGNDFLEAFVGDENLVTRVKAKSLR